MERFFFIRHSGKHIRLKFCEILYIEAVQNYTRLVMTGGRKYMALISMKQWEAKLPRRWFCRIQRSYIAGLYHVTAFDGENVYVPGVALPLGERYKKNLQQRITVVVCETRTKSAKRVLKHAA